MKRNNKHITDLFTSITRGDVHRIKINLNLTLKDAPAMQYKLISLFRKRGVKEQDFIKALFLTGVVEMSKKYLDELLKLDNIDIKTLLALFKAFRDDTLK